MLHVRMAPLRLATCAALLLPALVGCQMGRTTAPAPRRVFYPLPPDPPRMQYLTAINASWDVVPRREGFARVVLGKSDKATGADVLAKPYGIAAWQGKLYVCDQRGADVKVFDFIKQSYHVLSGPKRLIGAPTNLCITPDGYKFVVESMRGVIHAFDPQDEHVTTFQVKDARPGGIAAVGAELFVTDVTGDRVIVLDRATGKQVRTIGSKGKEPGQFLLPNAIAADSQGHLYVSDQMNFRFQKVDRNGKPLLTMGGVGDSYGHFARPRGIGVGPDGIIYVVESVYELVQMFDQKGQVLMAFGNYHAAPGFLELPAGIAIDKSSLPFFAKYVDPRFEPDYLVFVASQVGAARIGVYAFGHLKPGAEVPVMPVPPPPSRPAEQPTPPATPKPEPDGKPTQGEKARPAGKASR